MIDHLLQKIQENLDFNMIDENELHLAYNDCWKLKRIGIIMQSLRKRKV